MSSDHWHDANVSCRLWAEFDSGNNVSGATPESKHSYFVLGKLPLGILNAIFSATNFAFILDLGEISELKAGSIVTTQLIERLTENSGVQHINRVHLLHLLRCLSFDTQVCCR